MAEIIGTAIVTAVASEAVAATTIIGSLTVASVVGSATIIAGSAALNLLTSSLTDDRQRQAATQFSSQQPMPSRQRSYGRVKVAGPKVGFGVVAGAFCYGIYHGEGPWDAIEEWWLDDIMISFPPGGLGGVVPNVPWRGYVSIDSKLGTAPQTASGLLMGLDGYDESYRLDGCAYSAVQSRLPPEKKFKAYYPKQTWSELRVTARTQRVRDVRDPAQTEDPATWKFTDRSGPNIYDFLTHQLWGMRIPFSLMNTAKWAAFNALCDETFPDKYGNPTNRYSLGGTYQLTDDPIDTLNAMLSTCDGRLTLEPDGTIGITGGRFPIPTVTITDPAILAMEIGIGGSRYFEYTRLKISFVSPPHDYQQIEGQTWVDATAEADSGEAIEQSFSRPWVQNYNQVRRLAKIAMAKGNPDFKITGLVTDLSAAPALFEESVRLILSVWSVDAVFLVTRAVANVENGTCTFDLASIDPAAYSFDPTAEEGILPPLPGGAASEGPPPLPTGLAVSIERRDVGNGVYATFLRMTANPADRQDYSLIGRYRSSGDGNYLDMVADSDNRFSLISGVLTDGMVYLPEGALSNYGRVSVSDYISPTPASITAIADTSAPGPAYNITVSVDPSGGRIAFTSSASPNVASICIYRRTGTTGEFAGAILTGQIACGPNQAFDNYIDPVSPGSYRYWLQSRNGSGYSDASSITGPFDVTVV